MSHSTIDDTRRGAPRALTFFLLLLASGCGLEQRELGVAGAGGAPERDADALEPAPGVAGSSAASPPPEAPPDAPLRELTLGALCRPDVDACQSGLVCAATAAASVSRCCVGCAADEVCAESGASCEPRVRAQGEVCSEVALCAGALACTESQGGTQRCCALACASGQVCTQDGGGCELRAESSPCTTSAECQSGYCDIDERLCAPNPCAAAPAGKYCGRGAQCNTAAECVFTGRGMVAAGASHTCAILSTGAVRCWGDNESGQLGALVGVQPFVGDAANETPRSLADNQVTFGQRADGRPLRAVQVSAGGAHTCALSSDGAVRCWGANDAGQLAPTSADGNIALPRAAVQIDVGGAHACAVLEGGGLTCWGNNELGQLGFGNRDPVPNGVLPLVGSLTSVSEVVAGSGFTCALVAGGDVFCWGNPTLGALGTGNTAPQDAPPFQDVNVGADVLALGAGSGSVCAVIEGGFVRCWGDNGDGILGYGHTQSIGETETPLQASNIVLESGEPLGGNLDLGPGVATQVEVDTGVGYACALIEGALRCWGDANDGALGYGDEVDIGDDELPSSAGPVDFGGRAVLAIADGGRCAVLDDRSLVCWGRNTNGELGYPALFPDGSPSLTPAEILAQLGPVALE